jgi:hypothetical protein
MPQALVPAVFLDPVQFCDPYFENTDDESEYHRHHLYVYDSETNKSVTFCSKFGCLVCRLDYLVTCHYGQKLFSIE